MKTALESLPDELLLRRLVELLEQARVSEAELVAHIGEVDARRLYARESPSSRGRSTGRNGRSRRWSPSSSHGPTSRH